MRHLILLGMLLVLVGTAFAHQPRIVFDKRSSLNSPIAVEDPEISKAYYGELQGLPDYYRIDSEQDFDFYINILAPELADAETEFLVEVFADDTWLLAINTSGYRLERYYEEFGGDYYLRGPELEQRLDAGTYVIKVSNKENTGKYSLAVGEMESFPFKEAVKTIVVLPRLKKDFFEKSPLSAYWNLTGVFLLMFLIVLAGLVVGSVFLVRLLRRSW